MRPDLTLQHLLGFSFAHIQVLLVLAMHLCIPENNLTLTIANSQLAVKSLTPSRDLVRCPPNLPSYFQKEPSTTVQPPTVRVVKLPSQLGKVRLCSEIELNYGLNEDVAYK